MNVSQHSNKFQSLTLIWALAFSLANFRGTWIWTLLKQGLQITALPWVEVLIWILLGVLTIQSLRQGNLVAQYLSAWKNNWILLPFLVLCIFSLLWTISIEATLYKVAVLLFSSLVGAYIGFRYSRVGLLDILFRFGSMVLIICFLFAMFLPVLGAMDYAPYDGAWRGVFWHKNQFGPLAALFSMVFLIRALSTISRKEGKP